MIIGDDARPPYSADILPDDATLLPKIQYSNKDDGKPYGAKFYKGSNIWYSRLFFSSIFTLPFSP